jgi:hypothetical protein
MSSEQEQVRQLAERIARRVSQSAEQEQQRQSTNPASRGALNDELAALRQSLSELKERLANIESQLTPEDTAARVTYDASGNNRQIPTKPTLEKSTAPATRSPWLSGIYVPATTFHPSEEKFGVEEANVAELVDFFEGTKTCELEPGGKPCDHCAMCSSRGF